MESEWFGEDGTSTQLALALTSELEPPIHGPAIGARQRMDFTLTPSTPTLTI